MSHRASNVSPSFTSLDGYYCTIMHALWSSPLNDQRPAIREWLYTEAGRQQRLLDVGSGDPHYLSSLSPNTYTAVEPNPLLRAVTRRSAVEIGIQPLIYGSVREMLRSGAMKECDIVLMIHVLLYLNIEEAAALLSSCRQMKKRLLLVYPDPECSVSVAFERDFDITRSRSLLELKSDVLGSPVSENRIESHLTVPSTFSIQELAFLISHHVFEGTLSPSVLHCAERFAVARIENWRAGPYLKLPQSQIMEVYGPW